MRTVALLLSLLVGTFGISIASSFYFFWPGFQKIEQTNATENALRLRNSIDRELESLHIFLSDWTNWDDTYLFLMDQNADYIRSNLTETTFVDSSLSGIIFFNAQGELLWARGFDLNKGDYAPLDDDILSLVRECLPLDMDGKRGFLQTGNSITMFSARPVTDSQGTAAFAGAGVFLRPLDFAFLEALAERLQLSYRTENATPRPGEQILPPPLGAEQVTESARIIWFDLPLLNSAQTYRFHVETSRTITDTAFRALLWNTATVFLGSMLIFLVMNIALDRQIAQPLIRLSQRIVEMGRNTSCDPLEEDRHDEIGLIAHEVNRMQDRILSLAVHDYLTGLPNRRLFDDRLDHTLQRATRLDRQAVVIFIDLDGFKPVNDTYGHQFGDELLIAVAKRLTRITRKSDTVARLGGDEFAMIVELDDERENRLEVVCDKVLSTLTEPFRIRGREINITASLGCARFPDQTTDTTELLRMADEAMYGVKHTGKGAWRLYQP